ncbi:hypothetical protein SKAU_G00329050 [Synaphobranchus kaupii]|uniref:Uncharacterized protein n=1 Tax=Synaphobranchus kaupii TaxID=118154 RepID=A0A9Q1IKC0_SYNKA|nr:hypothetical protein SKAU_G00329050 [Synaphobranchus kaupii]
MVHPPFLSRQTLVLRKVNHNAVLEEVLRPPPESDQVYCCFLVDLDVPRLPQDLLHSVYDPPLTLELRCSTSSTWAVEDTLSSQGGPWQQPVMGDRRNNKAPDPSGHGALPEQTPSIQNVGKKRNQPHLSDPNYPVCHGANL